MLSVRTRAANCFGLLALLLAALATSCAAPDPSEDATDGDPQETKESVKSLSAKPDPSCVSALLGSHEYWACSATKTYAQASATCASVGLALARIDSAEENEFLRTKLTGLSAWIGATDGAAEGEWRWNDRDTFWANGNARAGAYVNWGGLEPNNIGDEDCGALAVDGRWFDASCALAAAFICETAGPPPGTAEPPDSTCTRSVRDGTVYWACSNARTWSDARSRCQSVGMDLTSLETQAEAATVKGFLNQDIHIGLNDRDREGQWRWTSSNALAFCGEGATAPGNNFSNWASGQPAQENVCSKVVSGTKGYWLCENSRTWVDAKDHCERSGLSLVRFDALPDDNLVASKLTKDSWIGANDRITEGKWVWTDNTQFWNGAANGAPTSGRFANWDPSQPDNFFNEDCGVLAKANGTWWDANCDSPPTSLGFVCGGGAQSDKPDTNDCAYARSSDGKWLAQGCASTTRAYVCEAVPATTRATLEQTTTSLHYDFSLGTARVLDATYKSEAQVKDPFGRFPESFGLRACEDGLSAGAPRLVRGNRREEVHHTQLYRGLPVMGHGYTVQRDPVTKVVASLTGNLLPNIAVATTPTVAESTALATAVTAVGTNLSSYSPPPSGRLMIVTKKVGRPEIVELAWVFKLPKLPGRDGHVIGVSAISGAVIMHYGELSLQCLPTPLPPEGQAALRADFTIADVQQTRVALGFSDPAKGLGTKRPLDSPILLASNGLSRTPRSPVYAQPALRTWCNNTLTPTAASPGVLTLADPLVAAVPEPGSVRTPAQVGSSMHVAMSRCLEYLANEMETRSSTPWLGIDGEAVNAINLELSATEPTSWLASLFRFQVNLNDTYGASIEVACHEMGHAIFDFSGGADDPPDSLIEAKSISEGFGDILGAAAEMSVRGYSGTGGFCTLGDEQKNLACDRDMLTPGNSKYDGVAVPLPDAYGSSLFCDQAVLCDSQGMPAGCCDPHKNSTVFSHWFALVSVGGAGTNNLQCPYDVRALSSDRETAVRRATRIAFNTIRDSRDARAGGFTGLAANTIQTAQSMFPNDVASLQTLEAAWQAVGVRNAVSGELYTPKPGSRAVSPWVQFRWRGEPNFSKYDFQLSRDSFATILVERANIGFETKVALPANSADQYVWRVRPTGANRPWTCVPTLGFFGTGPVEPPVVSPGNLTADGKIDSSQFAYVYFPSVPGATGYKVNFVQSDVEPVACPAAGAVDEPEATPVSVESGKHAVSFTLLPNTSYYAQVKAVGPPDATGAATEGPCVQVRATTGQAGGPTISARDGQLYSVTSPHVSVGGLGLAFEFGPRIGAVSHVLRFYRRNSEGACAPTPAFSVNAPGCPAGQPTCTVAVTALSIAGQTNSLAHPGGYCWDAVGVAANGAQSTPSRKAWFGYFAPAVDARTPGVPWRLPPLYSGAILGDSYGKPVTFSWAAVPGAVQYELTVYKWPRGQFDGLENPDNVITVPATRVFSTSTTISDPALVSEGRYCWFVRPLYGDEVGSLSDGQPTFDQAHLCYTVGPKLPEIVPDRPWPSAVGFSNAPITGQVKLPFVPDQQWKWQSSSPEIKWGDTICEPRFTPYTDMSSCHKDFTIIPEEGRTYGFQVDVFNGPAAPATNDPSNLVFSVKQSVSLGSCGASGELCCDNRACDASNLTCVEAGALGPADDTCGACGKVNQPCCNTTTCEENLSCNGSTRKCEVPLPDLKVDVVCNFGSPGAYVTIQNLGNATSTLFNVGLYCGYGPLAPTLPVEHPESFGDIWTLDPIPPQGVRAFIYNPSRCSGSSWYGAGVDIGKLNTEVNEANNYSDIGCF